MKPLFFLLLFITAQNLAFGQAGGTDPALKFDQRFTRCERKWIVLPKADTAKKYPFGFVYVDAEAGFTFQLGGYFTIGVEGNFITDTSAIKASAIKYRMSPKWRKVALLPAAHFAELHIKPEPRWIKAYYGNYTDTLAYNFRRGFNFNAAGQSDSALVYLNKVYRVKPHYNGLEFELMFAHNALGDYDGAVKITSSAIQYDPENVMFYRELGYAYLQEKNFDKSIAAYKKGIDVCGDGDSDTKCEMAVNLAAVYKASGNMVEYKSWGAQAKAWAIPGTDMFKFIVGQGF